MRDADIGVVPVVEMNQIIGMVTDRDIACRGLAGRRRPGSLTARDVMTKRVVACRPDDDLKKAVRVMERRRIRRLPVIDTKQGLVGMLTLGDIAKRAADRLSGEMLRAVSAHHL
jgi:CBS domain-containing protein